MKKPIQKPLMIRVSIQAGLVFFLFIGLFSCAVKEQKQTVENKTILISDSIYLNTGNVLVAKTFDTLRNSLLSAIKRDGFPGAITFCNERAYPITGTYADSVTIRRTALRFRNPQNQPDSMELLVLTEMDALVKASKIPAVKLIRNSSTGEIHFFKPIMLQPLCFNCHGTLEKQIQPATHARIQALYPDDQAINFNEGDLRGVWHIIFSSRQ
jgi:hypothetical protein